MRAEKLEFDNAELAAINAQRHYEQLADDAKDVRDDNLVASAAHELAKQPAEDAFEAAKLVKARVNPRFGPRESKAEKQAQLIASAIEISQAGPVQDVKYDTELATVKAQDAVSAFVKFNTGARKGDPTKYIPDAELARLWTVEHTKDPKLYQSQSPPWSTVRIGGRAAKLKKLFEDPKVPAEFKLTLVQKSGFLV